MHIADRRTPSTLDRYYYSAFDHAINPSWSPDGKSRYFRRQSRGRLGHGRHLCGLVDPIPRTPKQSSVKRPVGARVPKLAPDGNALLFTSYHGRQTQQLWLTTPVGAAPLPLTFGASDRRNPRWSPDGQRIATISNQTGNTALQVMEVLGGADAHRDRHESPSHVTDRHSAPGHPDDHGKPVPARVSIVRAAMGARKRHKERGCTLMTASTERGSRRKRTTSIVTAAARWNYLPESPRFWCSMVFPLSLGNRPSRSSPDRIRRRSP